MNGCYTLSDCTSDYLRQRQIDKEKYFVSYLSTAKLVWRNIFRNTLYVTTSKWLEIKEGIPYNYIEIPRDCERFFSVATHDECQNIVPIWYNNKLNVISKPATKKCSCATNCGCSGVCEDVNSMTYTTKLLFTINNVDYYEKTWLQYCCNGDIIEWRNVPIKKYNDFSGDGGDYNNDYNNDYDIADPPFSNFSIVYQDFQRKVCTLDIMPCGCPVESVANEERIRQTCCGFMRIGHNAKRLNCDLSFNQVNPNCYGECKISPCGNKIYVRNLKLDTEFLLLNYQTNGELIDGVVQVPEFSIEAMFTGIDWYAKRFNNAYSYNEKQGAKYEFNDEVNKLIMYLNPLNLQELAQVQDQPIRW